MSAHENECERTNSVSVPQHMNTHFVSATLHAGDGTGVTGSLLETGGCLGVKGAVSGVTSSAHSTLYNTPLQGYPVGQTIVFGDLSSGTMTTNLGSQSGVPNVFSMSAAAYAGTMPAGVPSTAPMAAARARSAPAARVNKSGSDTTV